MPTVPGNFNQTAYGTSPMANPSDTHALMAAAEMHANGSLIEPSRSMPSPPERPKVPSKKVRKLKVVK